MKIGRAVMLTKLECWFRKRRTNLCLQSKHAFVQWQEWTFWSSCSSSATPKTRRYKKIFICRCDLGFWTFFIRKRVINCGCFFSNCFVSSLHVLTQWFQMTDGFLYTFRIETNYSEKIIVDKTKLLKKKRHFPELHRFTFGSVSAMKAELML